MLLSNKIEYPWTTLILIFRLLPVVALFWRFPPGLSSVSGRLKASEDGLYPRGAEFIARDKDDGDVEYAWPRQQDPDRSWRLI